MEDATKRAIQGYRNVLSAEQWTEFMKTKLVSMVANLTPAQKAEYFKAIEEISEDG